MKRIFERHLDSVEQLQEEVLATLDHFQDPFSLMATTYMTERTIQRLFNPVKPEEVVMSQRVCRLKKGQSRFVELKTEVFTIYPWLRVLNSCPTLGFLI